MPKETVLLEPPTDGISAVKFGSFHNSLLVASSWDTYVRIYDADKNTVKGKYQHRAPVLDAAFIDEGKVASGGLDQSIKLFDIETGRESVLGAHSAPVRCVEYAPATNGVLTGSWDNSVRLWDPRKPGGEAVKLMAPAKVYSMSLAPEAGTIVVACADRKVATFDIRGAGAGGGAGAPAVAGAAAKVRDTALKHQLRCIRVMPDDEAGFIAGSIEGRCAVDFFSPDSGSAKPYTFKCHRVADPAAGAGEERIHPVNAIAFHPVHGTFATGGGDGTVLTWDWRAKKRLTRLRECDTSVSSLSFSRDGSKLAIGVSYTWEQGERPHPADSIVVREMTDAEIKPKA